MEPTKIHCLAKGISAGLWVDLEFAWAHACGKLPAVTCKRTWGSAGGHRRDFMVGCTLAAAAVTSCAVERDTRIVPALDQSRGSKSAEVQRVWQIYDDQLLFMARFDALDVGDVSRAWLVWSSAAETALADACQFAGGLVPERPHLG